MNLRSHRAPPRRRDEARDLFRNGILEAAEQVFGERGYHAARIQDIAHRARIAVGTVYNHFAHKDEVLAALVAERLEAMVASLAPAAGDPAPFRARLTRRLARLAAFVDAHRGFVAFVLGAAERARLDAAWLRLVDEGVAARALAAVDRAVLAAHLGAVVRAILVDSAPAGDRAALVTRLFLDGAGRPS